VIMVGLVVLLIVIVHAGVLYPREQCLASLDMGQELIDVESLQLGLEAKVDLYFSRIRKWKLTIGRCLLCRNVPMLRMLKQLFLPSWKTSGIKCI